MTNTINIYTDGAYSSATKVGGWAVVITQNNNLIQNFSNYKYETTNNQMELRAVLEALIYISNENIETANIYTDSAYIANAFKDKWYVKWEKNGWKTSNKTPVLNKELWTSILSIYLQKPFVNILKVEGHMGDKYNELADTLAVQARIKGAKEIEEEKN